MGYVKVNFSYFYDKKTDEFIKKKILFSGNIQSNSLIEIINSSIFVHSLKYSFCKNLQLDIKKKFFFGIFLSKEIVISCDTLIYFWFKNKEESVFYIMYLLSMFSVSNEVFIVGKNRSGVNSSKRLLKKWIDLKKISTMDRCALFYGKIKKNPKFIINIFFKIYFLENLVIKFLPGLFGYNGIDKGSLLLISTFNKSIKGKILDIGCGSGILSIYILSLVKKNSVFIDLVDICYMSLYVSRLNLKSNNMKASVYESNLYSNVDKKFNLIISNPPLHNDLDLDLHNVKNIIKNSKFFLKKKGELRIVTNTVTLFDEEFKKYFKNYNILAKNKNYRVYQGFN